MGVEYAGRVSGVEFGSGVLEAPSEFYGVGLVRSEEHTSELQSQR